MANLLEITVFDEHGEVDYRFTGTQQEINYEVDLLDPSVEYSVEASPWNATIQSAKALSEASVDFNKETA